MKTPRTDRNVGFRHGHPTEELVLASFARKLEKELIIAKRKLRASKLSPIREKSSLDQLVGEISKTLYEYGVCDVLSLPTAIKVLKMVNQHVEKSKRLVR